MASSNHISVGNIYYLPASPIAARSQPSVCSTENTESWRTRTAGSSNQAVTPNEQHLAEVEGHAVVVVSSISGQREVQVCVVTSNVAQKYQEPALRAQFLPLGGTPPLDGKAGIKTNRDDLFSDRSYVRVVHSFPVARQLLQPWQRTPDIHIYDDSWDVFTAMFEHMNKVPARTPRPRPSLVPHSAENQVLGRRGPPSSPAQSEQSGKSDRYVPPQKRARPAVQPSAASQEKAPLTENPLDDAIRPYDSALDGAFWGTRLETLAADRARKELQGRMKTWLDSLVPSDSCEKWEVAEQAAFAV